MTYLVVYGTFDGHTAKIAQAIADQIGASADVRLLDAEAARTGLDWANISACIIVAPVHQQHHPDTVVNFATAHAADLGQMRSAFVSVSLSAAFEDGLPEAQSYVDSFLATTGWQTSNIHLAAGALSYTKYDFFQEQIIRHVVLKGRAPEQIEGDNEFTDWNALTTFVTAFMGS